MKNYPQTFALKVAKNIKAIGDSSCLAMCYLYCVGIDGDASDYCMTISNAMEYSAKLPEDKQFLNADCTVLDAAAFLEFETGKHFKVLKKEFNDISEIKEPTPVRFSYNGYSHWVVIEDGKIVFNSLANSNCVNKGHLDHNPKNPNARVIKLV